MLRLRIANAFLAVAGAMVLCSCGSGTPGAWAQYGSNPQHSAISPFRAMPLNRVVWQAPIDLMPQYSNGGQDLLIHYGTPIVTGAGTVILTVKTGAAGGFRVDGHALKDGTKLWTESTDYVLPSHGWTPPVGSTLAGASLVTPAAGGTVLVRAFADNANSPVGRVAFFGNSVYSSSPADTAAYNQTVFVSTPISSDNAGNIYFGFRVTGSNPAGLSSGFARISSTGKGTWTPASTASGDPGAAQPLLNAAPALSNDGSTLYVVANNGGRSNGYLVALDAKTLARKNSVKMMDPRSGQPATAIDDGTASPLIGPDGDVFMGVFENPGKNSHGWMLHYDGTLNTQKPTGAFGWDDTGSIVPASAVKAYKGTSKYLILSKYNNYADFGPALGDGHNRVAILDPNVAAPNAIAGISCMAEVQTVLGVTPDTHFPNQPGAVREWCINSAAVDPAGHCAIVNSEDGKCYHWNFDTNTLDQVVTLTPGIGEAYTPTVITKGGYSIAVNNATVFVLGK